MAVSDAQVAAALAEWHRVPGSDRVALRAALEAAEKVRLAEEASTERNYVVRADGEFVRDSLGRLVKFTQNGAHRWADRRKPMSYTVIQKTRS